MTASGQSRVNLRGEAGLALAIVVVIALTIALDPQRNYIHQARASAIEILRQTSMLGIFALGSAVVIIAGGIDLSSGSMIAFSGTIAAIVMLLLAPDEMRDAKPIGASVITAAIVAAIASGLLIGSLHTWLITVIGLPPFIATLATLVGLRSLGRALIEHTNLHVFGGRTPQIAIFDQSFRYLATSIWIPVAIFLALAAILWLVMSRTVPGRHLYALGGNEHAARLSGVRTDRLKWLAYCISAVTASIAGVLYIGDQSVADPQTLGRGYELNAIAAAVVGGCSLQGGVGTIPGTVLGCLFQRVVIDGIAKIIKTGADAYEGMIVGIVVVVAVALNQVRASRQGGKAFFPGALGAVAVVNLALLFGAVATLGFGPKTGGLVAVIALLLFAGLKAWEARRARRPAQEPR